MQGITYRPDIDGLRGIAIVATLGYHAFPEWVPGGFVGVDIFFVISGFLITSILLLDFQAGYIDIAGFYVRRIRRIFPALIAVLLAVLGIGWVGLYADEYQQLGKHVAAAAGFVSNFVFWQELGYFDNAAVTKPLLHTWSLAVEEQFYLLWPWLLWAAKRWHLRLAWTMGALAVGSFAMGIGQLQSDAGVAFFWPHTRVWELALGGLLALRASNGGVATPSRLRAEVTGLTGLALMLGSAFLLTSDQTYPGWRALLPTMGAMLVIASWTNTSLVTRWMAHPGLVGLGLISYPLYLWHWPLLSMAHVVYLGTPPLASRVLLLVLAVSLAWLTWRWIERPVRSHPAGWRLAVSLLMSLTIVGTLGGAIFLKQGLPGRLPHVIADANRTQDWEYPSPEMRQETMEGVRINRVGGEGAITLFFGDSNVEQYGPRINHLLKSQTGATRGAVFLTEGGMMPVEGIRRMDGRTTRLEDFMRLALLPNVDRIVIGAAWPLYFNSDKQSLGLDGPIFPRYFIGDDNLESPLGHIRAAESLGQTVRILVASGKTVYLVACAPAGRVFAAPTGLLSRGFPLKDSIASSAIPSESLAPLWEQSSQWLAEVAQRSGAIWLDPIPSICPNGLCPAGIHKDAGHLRASFVRHKLLFLDQTVTENH